MKIIIADICITLITLSLYLCDSYASNIEVAKAYKAIIMIENFSSALDRYQSDTGKFPSSEEGLTALIIRPENSEVTNWLGPYLACNKIPLAPWCNPFIYKFPGNRNKENYDLYSTGLDGTTLSNGNDEDDLNNWQNDEEWKDFYRPKTELLPRLVLATILLSVVIFWVKKSISKN